MENSDKNFEQRVSYELLKSKVENLEKQLETQYKIISDINKDQDDKLEKLKEEVTKIKNETYNNTLFAQSIKSFAGKIYIWIVTTVIGFVSYILVKMWAILGMK